MGLIRAGIFFCVALSGLTSAVGGDGKPTLWETVRHDYQQFYSRDRLVRFGTVFCGGAAVANTTVDKNVQEWYQNRIRSSSTDQCADVAKKFGEGEYVVPLFLFWAAVDLFLSSDETSWMIGEWGTLTARAYLVGGPAMLFMQRVTGASRPDETDDGSRWCPFHDENGVSGHAFIGAVPFLVMARMRGRGFLKYVSYILSCSTALSRINDNAHFFSQAALGWYLAWEATDAVCVGDREKGKLTIMPCVRSDGYGVRVWIEW